MSGMLVGKVDMKNSYRFPLPKNSARRLTVIPATVDECAERLLAYWTATASQETGLPDRRTFDAVHMIEWLGFFSIYEYDQADDDFYNRLEGTFVIDLIGENWTGRRASDVDRHFGSRFHLELDEVRRGRQPVIDLVQIYQSDYRQAIRLMLPVSKNGNRTADQIFVAMFACGHLVDRTF